MSKIHHEKEHWGFAVLPVVHGMSCWYVLFLSLLLLPLKAGFGVLAICVLVFILFLPSYFGSCWSKFEFLFYVLACLVSNKIKNALFVLLAGKVCDLHF